MNTFKDHIFIAEQAELIPLILKSYSHKSVIIVSQSASQRFGINLLLHSLDEQNSIRWISSFSSNPTQEDIKKCLNTIGTFSFDKILAIGGGSAIDLSKAIIALHQSYINSPKLELSIEEITKCITQKTYLTYSSSITISAIPTTAGTGSEVTAWATIWDINKAAKYSIEAPYLVPETVFLIPELTCTLPIKTTLATSLDALSHAMEAYWARSTSSEVKQNALTAVQIITSNLPLVIKDPNNIQLREQLLIASCIAGLAFAQTKTTACHSISYPLTYLYGIEHGFAVAMTLPQIATINKREVPDIELLLKCFYPYGTMDTWLSFVCEPIVDLHLSNWGITESDIPCIAKHAFTKGRMDNNPVALTEKEVTNILYNIL